VITEALEALSKAERPILIFGAGVRLADAAKDARGLANLLGVPVAVTWGARDLFPDHPNYLCVGGFGTHGTRAANFAVQNADWILSVGSRLDSKATGTPRSYFARGASIFMADIDMAEIRKFGGELGRKFCGVQADAKLFLRDMTRELARASRWPANGSQARAAWQNRCADWIHRYDVLPADAYQEEVCVNPYVLVSRLSAHCEQDEVIVSDTGLSLAWLMQAFRFKSGQRFVHAFNQTPMGYGLPAAIGAAFARPGQRVVLVNGDGSFMLNVQELALVAQHRLPVKILLINNDGHAMCRQTQDQWLGGNYYSTSSVGGLCFPDFCAVAQANGLRTSRLMWTRDIDAELAELLAGDDPAFLEVVVDGAHRLVPQVPYGRPNEDGDPRLPRDELREQMTVELVE
jgi:acetolactate synthase-1/2/3 large subunit